MAKKETPKKRRVGKVILIVFTILLILGLAGFGGYYFYKYNQLKKKPVETVQKEALQAESKQLLKDVGDRVELPKDEQPTIYTVQDKTKLASQVFFANAENGDKALIFSKAKIAILFRPSTKKVINVGPVNIADSITPTVAIIGTTEARDAMELTMNDKLKDKFKLGTKTDAKLPPTEVLVVDLTGTNTDAAKSFADAIGGKVGDLPPGEDKPANTDILVIAK